MVNDQFSIYGMKGDVIQRSFYGQKIVVHYFFNPVITLYKKISTVCLTGLRGRFPEFKELPGLITGLQEPFKRKRLNQIVKYIQFKAVNGIFSIGCGQDDRR